MKEITEILRTEGILSQGFGISPKILYRDRRLSPEAKAIYGYIASFAGNGNSAFPSRDIMLEELGMSSKRYYKHFSLLQQCGYITVTKQRDRYGSFDRNVYTLVSNPVPEEEDLQTNSETELCGAAAREQVECSVGDAAERKQAKRSRINYSESRNFEQRGRRQAPMPETGRGNSWLREVMAIDEISQQQPNDKKHLEKIYMAATDMADSEQIKVGGTIKSREQIAAVLNNLNADTTRTVLFKFKKILNNKEYKIYNMRSFLQTLICNSPFEIEDFLTYQDAQRQKAEDAKKDECEQAEKTKRYKILDAHPELRTLESDYTEVMRRLTKVMLTDNAAEKEQLMRKRDEIDIRRRTYLEDHGLPDIV